MGQSVAVWGGGWQVLAPSALTLANFCQAWAWFSTACWFQGTPGGGAPGEVMLLVPRALRGLGGLSRFTAH